MNMKLLQLMARRKQEHNVKIITAEVLSYNSDVVIPTWVFALTTPHC